MKTFLLQILATIIAFVLMTVFVVFAGFGFLASSAVTQEKETLPDTIVLRLDLRRPLTDKGGDGFFVPTGSVRSVVDIVQALAKAEDDDRVKGLYYRVGAGLPVAQAAELREAIRSFEASGKFTMAYAQSLFSSGLGDYYMAAEADEIWMQPESHILASGVGGVTPFLKGLLDKIDAKYESVTAGTFKNANEPLTRNEFSEPARQATEALVTSIYAAVTSDVAADRAVDREALKRLLDTVPHATHDAIEAGLIDRMGYVIDSEDAALEMAGGKAKFLSLGRYYRSEGTGFDSGEVIALVHGDGVIVEGPAVEDPFNAAGFGGDSVSKAILKAAEDDAVKAIVFRVNSPGGASTASDQVLDALKRAQARGKPVVVSMADVAASGGYWVSMYADRIVAHPVTVTGSIGVLAGKPDLSGTYEEIGINMVPIVEGERTLMFSDTKPFTEEERAALGTMISEVYDGFTTRVAEGRKLPLSEVREIAEGRVWSGSDAMDLKLVDAMGGMRTAIAEAKRLADIDADANIQLRRYPREGTVFEQLAQLFGASAEVVKLAAAMNVLLGDERLAKIIETRKVMEQEGAVSYTPVEVR